MSDNIQNTTGQTPSCLRQKIDKTMKFSDFAQKTYYMKNLGVYVSVIILFHLFSSVFFDNLLLSSALDICSTYS